MPDRTCSPQEIPSDVTDREKYWYFGPQRRWFLVLRFVTFLGVILSVARFGLEDPHTAVMILVIFLMTAASGASLYASTRPRSVSQSEHERRVASWAPSEVPSVDVFLPSAGEPLAVLANTYRHVAALDYPGEVTVYALDDSGREQVRQLAERYGFRYLSRPDRGRLNKAGNLAYGYDNSEGDVITILDADFAARPEYLLELMPYLDDPSVGIAQSPQFFDTELPAPWLQRSAGYDQELFYRSFQASLDSVGAPICVGTCAVYRRSALHRIGGFTQLAHSEDIYTGVAMMDAGYQVRYVPVILAKGLCPSSIPPYLCQQYRWCSGSITLMLNLGFRVMGMTWRQRLCFWSGFSYYISSAVLAFAAFLPPVWLLWYHPDSIRDHGFLLLFPAVFAYPLSVLLARGRWDFGVLRVQIAQSFSHAVAIWDAWRDHDETWVATGASSSSPLARRISRLMVSWLVGVQVLLWAGVVNDLAARTLSFNNAYPLILFALLALYLEIPLIQVTVRPPTVLEALPA